jgi:hypothetical protein
MCSSLIMRTVRRCAHGIFGVAAACNSLSVSFSPPATTRRQTSVQEQPSRLESGITNSGRIAKGGSDSTAVLLETATLQNSKRATICMRRGENPGPKPVTSPKPPLPQKKFARSNLVRLKALNASMRT